MANKIFKVSSSLAVRKVVNGDTLYIVINNPNGVPLFQGYDDSTNSVVPNWEAVGATQPLLIPSVTSARGQIVSLSNHQWKYNNSTINWKNVENGWFVENATKPRFKMRESDGALQIIANLASTSNPSTDTLTYSGTATYGGNNIGLEKSVDVVIQKLGSSSFGGGLTATSLTVGKDSAGNDIESSTISSKLYNSVGDVTNYTCKWYIGNNYQSGKDGKTFVITKDMVDTQALVIAEFYITGNSTPVFKAAISITDNTDMFKAILNIDRLPDTNKPGTVTAKLICIDTDKDYTAQIPDIGNGTTMSWDIRRKDTWESIKHSDTNSIVVTVDDFNAGKYNGTEVEVTLDLTTTLNI